MKNCSLFELVKTNNQDQQRATKLSPDRPEERQPGSPVAQLSAADSLFVCGLQELTVSSAALQKLVFQCIDETDFILIKFPILNNSLFAS